MRKRSERFLFALGSILVVLVVAIAPASAQDYKIPKGSTLFIEDMDNDLDGYIKAEMVKRKVAVRIVSTAEEAQYVMLGSSTGREKRSWHEGWLTAEKDKTTGNVSVVDQSTKTLVWAGEAGDRSMWWGALARGGPRKVASRIVGNFKKVVK